MLVTRIIGFAQGEVERSLLLKWFKEEALVTKEGQKISSVIFTKKHKHAMVKKIYSSK